MLLTYPNKGKGLRVAHLVFRSSSLVLALVLLGWAWMGGKAQRAPEETSADASPKHSSSAIAITSDGNMLLAVNPDSNSLAFVDTASQAVIKELPVGIDPRSVAISPDNLMGIVAN